MKLIYRGVTYDYNPPAVNYGDLTQAGKYQGLDIRFRNRKKPLVIPSTLRLIYRGNTYTAADLEKVSAPQAETPVQLIYRGHTYTKPAQTANQPVAAVAEPSAAPGALSISDRARALMMGHHRAVKRRQQSMLTRLDARVGLPATQASQFWNHIRGEAHPSFGDSYDRSHAALS